MIGRVNTKVAGSLLMGVGLVAVAFLLSKYSPAPTAGQEPMRVIDAPAPERTAIAVGDSNSDGVEDWREPFLTAEPVLLNTDLSDYERDNTLTEQVSINLMENLLMSKSMGGAGVPNADLVRQSTNQAIGAVQDKIYTAIDISVIPETTPELVREYGNAVANVLSNNDIEGLRNELLILEDAVRTKDPIYFNQIIQKSEMYGKNRDMLLGLPVPITLTSEHLRLINAFNVLSNDLFAMTEIDKDPLKSLLRLRQYQENSVTMAFAMQAMYQGLSNYPTAIKPNDPALLFSLFADVRRPI